MKTFVVSFEEGEEGAVARFFADFYGKGLRPRNLDPESETEEG